ncbi:MAG: phosphatidyl-myo-inositol alpha-mannosyltransferase [Thermoleophilaceae bacterium]|nr:phosphatidyl-myo-inositol alpha-mannosyltransferase [Thermoleophilaceae bacterium]
MRILFVSHYALPHVGGIEAVIDALGRELTARGYDVAHVASDALRPGEHLEPGGAERPYRMVRVSATNVLESRLGVPVPIFGPGLLRVLREEVARADVVHAHGFLYAGSAVAFALARRAPSRPARVLTEHVGHVAYERRSLDRVEAGAIATLGRATARRAHAMTAYSERVVQELRALAPDVPIERIENGVDSERYRPPREGERERLRAELGWDERPRVLFVGRDVAKKGLPLALATASAGGGAFRLAVVAPRQAVPGGAAHVDPLGALPRERLAEVYRAADAFLLPSHGEGFPLSVQEAMASGLPAVLAHDPSYESILDGAGDGARLVEPEAEALAGAIARLTGDPPARAGASEAATRHARTSFSWARATDAHERLYKRVSR